MSMCAKKKRSRKQPTKVLLNQLHPRTQRQISSPGCTSMSPGRKRFGFHVLHASNDVPSTTTSAMKQSSGTLLYRRAERGLEVLLVHPSGNYNRRAPWG